MYKDVEIAIERMILNLAAKNRIAAFSAISILRAALRKVESRLNSQRGF